jgi:hypothetical protein
MAKKLQRNNKKKVITGRKKRLELKIPFIKKTTILVKKTIIKCKKKHFKVRRWREKGFFSYRAFLKCFRILEGFKRI